MKKSFVTVLLVMFALFSVMANGGKEIPVQATEAPQAAPAPEVEEKVEKKVEVEETKEEKVEKEEEMVEVEKKVEVEKDEVEEKNQMEEEKVNAIMEEEKDPSNLSLNLQNNPIYTESETLSSSKRPSSPSETPSSKRPATADK